MSRDLVTVSGGQRTYTDVAIEAAMTIRMVFHLSLRQTEGFLGCLGDMLEAAHKRGKGRTVRVLIPPGRNARLGEGGFVLFIESCNNA